MSSRKLKAFIKYSKDDTIVPGLVLRRTKRPAGPRWVQIPESLCCSEVDFPTFFRTHGDLKAWVKYTKKGNIVADSLILRKERPKSGGIWKEFPYRLCCIFTTTTTTTTTSTTTTSTTSSTTTSTTTVEP